MKTALVLCAVYALFLLWHHRWFSRPLTKDEVAQGLGSRSDVGRPAVSEEERENLLAFLAADDGKPFYMVNLMQYREKALYPDDRHVDVETGRQANALYTKAVMRELLKRGSYPVFLSRKMASFLTAGEGSDFFEEVGIIRYRSRRDLLEIIRSPGMTESGLHKWASMERTVAVPTRRLLLVDLGVIVPLVLMLVGLLVASL